ncbi:MAG: hypothetical protein GY718_09800 [Lentisphaerae bacterium]|nr:hypothetical protein [Lentisphaerota bacterium]
MTKKNVTEKESTESLCFNESTQARIKDFVGIARAETSRIEKDLQAKLGLIVATFQETRGIKGQYGISQDFKRLEKFEKQQ